MSAPTPPPRWALRLLRGFCHPDYLEDIEGDLMERYQRYVDQYGVKTARRRFVQEVALLFRFNLLRPFPGLTFQFYFPMLRHYFLIALRNVNKQRLYSALNISGLSLGLACFILIILFVQHEYSYDQFFPEAEQIHYVIQRQPNNEYMGSNYFSMTPAGLAPAMKSSFPEVRAATSISTRPALLSREEQHFFEDAMWVDQQFFKVFQLELLQGDTAQALTDPYSIVLSQSLAKKIFGVKNPIGERLVFQQDTSYTVTGVIADFPKTSSFQFSFLINFQSDERFLGERENQVWNNSSYYTFLRMNRQGDVQALNTKLVPLIAEHEREAGFSAPNEFTVHKLSELHLQSHVNMDIGEKGSKKQIRLLTLIGSLILLLACMNYMNLAIAQSIRRAKEVGLRKVIGAYRKQIRNQFFVESILIAFLALGIAMGWVYGLLPYFGQLLEREITFHFWEQTWLLPGLFALVAAVGILAGSYPALYMASLPPVDTLKSKLKGLGGHTGLQRVLITAQYVISITLIICSLVVKEQLDYIQNKELGYNKEHILAIRIHDQSILEDHKALAQALRQHPNVQALTLSSSLPIQVDASTLLQKIEGKDPEEDLRIYDMRATPGLLDVFDIELIAGKAIDMEDASGYLLNETAVRAMGWTPETAIGKTFEDWEKRKVTGVVKDFHMHSMELSVKPLMLRPNLFWLPYLSVKIHPEGLSETLAFLQQSLAEFSPYPFEYQFVDEHFDQLYRAEQRLGESFALFTLLAIIIASLGLFGLAAFHTEMRTKEIGVRKVLGASSGSIVALLTRNVMLMVVLAFGIAIPIAWWSMDQWLQGYVYRVEMPWWVFGLAGAMAIVIAFVTVSYLSIRAAGKNPVHTLRSE